MSLRVDTLLSDVELRTDPFPHIVKKDALPPDTYDLLKKTRLPDEVIDRGGKGQNSRIDAHTYELCGTGVWKDFLSYYTGEEFFSEVVRVFGDEIKALYPDLPLENQSVGVRFTGDFDISTECQIGINTPCETRSRVIGPHLDNPCELYAGLLYMPVKGDKWGGDFEIRKYTSLPRFYGKLKIDDDCTEVVCTVPYEPNTFVMFINSPWSVHSVSERGPCKEYRRLVNIIGEVRKPLFGVKNA